jgi:hypothetical protein
MRMTVNIPDLLYRALKSKAAREEKTVKELILRGLEDEVQVTPRRRLALCHLR